MAAPRKLDAKAEARLVKAYQKGTSLANLRDEFGVSAGTIRSVVVRAGVELRPVGRPKTKV